MLTQLLKLNRLNLILIAIVIVVMFGFVQFSKADEYLTALDDGDYFQSMGICNERVHAQSFTINTPTVIKGFGIYIKDSDNGDTIVVEFCDDAYSGTCLYEQQLFDAWASTTLMWTDSLFTESQWIAPGEYWLRVSTDDEACPSTPWSFGASNLSGANTDYYTGGMATSTIGGGGAPEDDDDFTMRLILGDSIDYGNVEIADLNEWDEITVTTEAENLLFEDEKLCFVGNNCTYRIWYSQDEVGAYAAIIKQWYSTLTNQDDYVLGLPGFDTVNSLKYDFNLETQESATSTDYYLVILGDDASSSNVYDFSVTWLASTTDDLTQVSWIMKTFKNIFPISIVLQIKEVFDSHTSTTSVSLIDINLQDIIPYEHSGFSASGTILSAELINDNFSLWQELFYPYLRYFIWIIAFVYIVIRMRNLATSSDTG